MILVKLILAHLLGDFFLQPRSWILNKYQKRWKSPHLYFHVVIHFGLILLIFRDPGFWQLAAFIALTHLAIDLLKLQNQTPDTESFWFYADQFLHIAVLIVVWVYLMEIPVFTELPDTFWIFVTGMLFLTIPCSFLIRHAMNKWDGQLLFDEENSLEGAGKYIGILERLFIYAAVLTANLQVIGFLLAAKSVFRFGDLTRAKDRKLTEYILVGTLTSFLLAIGTGMLVKHWIN